MEIVIQEGAARTMKIAITRSLVTDDDCEILSPPLSKELADIFPDIKFLMQNDICMVLW